MSKQYLKIWTEENVKVSSDDQIFIKLFDREKDNDIILAMVDKTGKKIKKSNILMLEQDMGIIILAQDVNQDIPLRQNLFGEVECYTATALDAREAGVHKRSAVAIDARDIDLKEILEGILKGKQKDKKEEKEEKSAH